MSALEAITLRRRVIVMKYWSFVAAVILSAPLFAQTPPPQIPPPAQPAAQPAPAPDAPQGPTFRTGVELLTIDVAAVDGKGRPVSDLRAPDFMVKVDGEPRRVVSADLVTFDVDAARKEAADASETFFTTNLAPPTGRMIVIAVDQSNIRPGAARPLLSTAARFLNKLSPADRVAFVAYPQPGVSVDFTRDHARIREAMGRVTGTQSRHRGKFNIGIWEAVRIAESQDEVVRREVVSRECAMSGTAPMELERCEREVEIEAADQAQRQRADTNNSLRGLRALLQDLLYVDGQKALILLSEGLILETAGSELDEITRMAAIGRVNINVLLMDVPRFEVTQSQLPPSATEDREMQVQGLEALAGMSRGALFHVVGTGENIFDRLASEMSAYYLVGVEQAPGDRDGKRHRIDVEVRRRNVTLRSRRAFVLNPGANRSVQENLIDTLKAPFGVTGVPMRVTTYAYQDPASDKVRLVVAAEVGQPGAVPAEYTMGFALFDDRGGVPYSGSEKRLLQRVGGRTNGALEYLMALVVEPGVYSLRLGAVDSEGRRGSVVRDVNAWKMAGEEFAVGDLIVGNVPRERQPIRPGVEPRVHDGQLGAYLELYSTSPAAFERTTVTLDIAEDQDAPALTTAAAQMLVGQQPTWRVAQGQLTARMLPPGRYVARAKIVRNGSPVGVLLRPFILEGPAATSDGTGEIAVPASMLASLGKFDRQVVLAPAFLGALFDGMEKAKPALKPALAEARAGRYGTAALEALGAGDDATAMLLKGLDLYVKGQLDAAATQLNVAAGPRRENFAAALYLGACFAEVGRDRDAAGVWQLAIGREPRPALAYTIFADARLRDGQPASVIDVLKPAHALLPDEDGIAKRLSIAYVMTGRYADAAPVLDAYLVRHPADQEALFAAVMSHYEVATQEKRTLSDGDRAKLLKYARAYRGPQQALVEKYLTALQVR